MSDVLCIAPDCGIRGRHVESCDGEDCRGCLPRRAADTLMLCPVHRDKLERQMAELPALHDELVNALTRSGSAGDGKRRSTGIALDDDTVKARDHILMWLWSWTRIVMEERGLYGPTVETPSAVATWLIQHVDWLAAKPYADEVSKNLADTWTEAMIARQANRTRRIELRLPDGTLAGCLAPAEGPRLPGAGEPLCCGTLTALLRPADGLLPHEIVCDGDDTHRWPADEWVALGKRQVRRMDAGGMTRLTRAISA